MDSDKTFKSLDLHGLPAADTDESIRAGTYFYGSLSQCPKSGPGKWSFYNKEGVSIRVQSACSAGLITIVETTSVVAGPKSKSHSQWGKSGASPNNVRANGCIITESFAEVIYDRVPKNKKERNAVFVEFQKILQNPHQFLHLKCVVFL